MTTTIQKVLSGTRNLAFMFVAALGLAGCSPPASAGTYDCVPIGAKSGDKLKATHNATLLSAGASKELGAGIGTEAAVVLVVDRGGNVHTFVPAPAQGAPRLCKAKYPLHAGELLNAVSIGVQATSNPKVCWYDSNGQLQCIEW